MGRFIGILLAAVFTLSVFVFVRHPHKPGHLAGKATFEQKESPLSFTQNVRMGTLDEKKYDEYGKLVFVKKRGGNGVCAVEITYDFPAPQIHIFVASTRKEGHLAPLTLQKLKREQFTEMDLENLFRIALGRCMPLIVILATADPKDLTSGSFYFANKKAEVVLERFRFSRYGTDQFIRRNSRLM